MTVMSSLDLREDWRALLGRRPALAATPTGYDGIMGPCGAAEEAALQRFAEAWDRGGIGPAALLPAQGRVGSLEPEIGLERDAVAFLACVSLRPGLDGLFSDCRVQLVHRAWDLGVRPFCG